MSDNFETIAIRTQTERSSHKEHSAPIYLTSSYKFDDAEEMRALFANEKEGNVYSRYSNPNTSEFIEKMALLEGGKMDLLRLQVWRQFLLRLLHF